VLVDFYQILVGETKDKSLELYPDFIIGRSEDLMVQGGKFYAIWDPEKGLWSRDEYDVQRLVDEDLAQERGPTATGDRAEIHREVMRSFLPPGHGSGSSWPIFRTTASRWTTG
jgi:hypothetical protein